MGKILRPRRGSASTAKSQLTGSNILLKGEVFFELPTTGIGKDEGKIILGDGSSDYGSLVPFIDPAKYVHNGKVSDETISFTETSTSDTTSVLKTIVSGASLKTLITGVKNGLSNINSALTTANTDLTKAKGDIDYHWNEIGKKVPLTTQSTNSSGTKYDLPPFAMIRMYCTTSVTVPANNNKWISVQKSHLVDKSNNGKDLTAIQSYIMQNANNEYIRLGAVGAYVGAYAGETLKCSFSQFSSTGMRLWNNTSSAITTPNTVTFSGSSSAGYQLKNCPPYLDMLFVRKDCIEYCY